MHSNRNAGIKLMTQVQGSMGKMNGNPKMIIVILFFFIVYYQVLVPILFLFTCELQ